MSYIVTVQLGRRHHRLECRRMPAGRLRIHPSDRLPDEDAAAFYLPRNNMRALIAHSNTRLSESCP